jgi:hypothetical protein
MIEFMAIIFFMAMPPDDILSAAFCLDIFFMQDGQELLYLKWDGAVPYVRPASRAERACYSTKNFVHYTIRGRDPHPDSRMRIIL